MRRLLFIRHRAKKISRDELDGFYHPASHWLLVVLGALLISAIFSLVGFLVFFSGWSFWQAETSWFQIAIGFPLMLLGGSLILINLYQILAAVFDRRYSKSHCPICKKVLH